MEIQLKGMAEMIAKLKKAQQQVTGPGVRKAVAKGARIVRDGMTARAPILTEKQAGSNALEPGALRAGMRSYVVTDSNPVEAIAGPGEAVAYVARFVEYGHRTVTGGSLSIHGKGKGRQLEQDVPAHPFLRPAFEESVTAVGEAIAESLSETFKEALR
jgi:HK97 gp10 family phage protein